jgi:hypothetical protein
LAGRWIATNREFQAAKLFYESVQSGGKGMNKTGVKIKPLILSKTRNDRNDFYLLVIKLRTAARSLFHKCIEDELAHKSL